MYTRYYPYNWCVSGSADTNRLACNATHQFSTPRTADSCNYDFIYQNPLIQCGVNQTTRQDECLNNITTTTLSNVIAIGNQFSIRLCPFFCPTGTCTKERALNRVYYYDTCQKSKMSSFKYQCNDQVLEKVSFNDTLCNGVVIEKVFEANFVCPGQYPYTMLTYCGQPKDVTVEFAPEIPSLSNGITLSVLVMIILYLLY